MPAIDVLLLLALPASGKSEIRRYLDSLDPVVLEELGMVSPVDLDDYPYVHLMRRVCRELRRMEEPPVFFITTDTPMIEPRDWGTLIHLLNEDFRAIGSAEDLPADPALWLFDRFDRARTAVGAQAPFAAMDASTRGALAAALGAEAAELAASLATNRSAEGTVIIEFARGGPEGAAMPLPDPLGYQYSLRHLDPEILRRASILYVWVTPENSRHRNLERARPDGDPTILFHGVPDPVMRLDYGTDDIAWLLETSNRPGTIRVDHADGVFHLPAARFDNREDLTSFLREDPQTWPQGSVKRLHGGLQDALTSIHPE
jgi:hypothetical protein